MYLKQQKNNPIAVHPSPARAYFEWLHIRRREPPCWWALSLFPHRPNTKDDSFTNTLSILTQRWWWIQFAENLPMSLTDKMTSSCILGKTLKPAVVMEMHYWYSIQPKQSSSGPLVVGLEYNSAFFRQLAIFVNILYPKTPRSHINFLFLNILGSLTFSKMRSYIYKPPYNCQVLFRLACW